MCFETLNHGSLVDCDINLEGYDWPLKKTPNRTELKGSRVIILQNFYVAGISKGIFSGSVVYPGTMFSTGLEESG